MTPFASIPRRTIELEKATTGSWGAGGGPGWRANPSEEEGVLGVRMGGAAEVPGVNLLEEGLLTLIPLHSDLTPPMCSLIWPLTTGPTSSTLLAFPPKDRPLQAACRKTYLRYELALHSFLPL